MKPAYALIALVLVVVAGISITSTPAGTFEDDPGPIVAPEDTYDPVRAGEAAPVGFHQVLARDDIRPVYNPRFMTASQATWHDDALVIGVELDGEAKAYPVTFLSYREMVNDEIAGTPILVTWCPLCATAMVHQRELGDKELVFGNQGALWRGAMTWWDHDTGTVWSQPLGEAIVGPRKGAKLEPLASSLTSWKTWRETHPETLALEALGQSPRFYLKDMTIVVDFDEEVGVYPVAELWRAGPANDVIAGAPIAVVTDPKAMDRWAVFSRVVGDQVLTLTISGDKLVDQETGTTWDPTRGTALAGPLEGEALGVLPGFTAFESDALKFWPEAKVWGDDGAADSA